MHRRRAESWWISREGSESRLPTRAIDSGRMEYRDAAGSHTAAYLWPAIVPLLPPRARVFDLGAGNGAFVEHLLTLEFDACGVDPSESGVAVARGRGLPVALGSG